MPKGLKPSKNTQGFGGVRSGSLNRKMNVGRVRELLASRVRRDLYKSRGRDSIIISSLRPGRVKRMARQSFVSV